MTQHVRRDIGRSEASISARKRLKQGWSRSRAQRACTIRLIEQGGVSNLTVERPTIQAVRQLAGRRNA